MNIIPKNLDDWNLDTINELIKLRDIESERFDFKGKKITDLSNHLCAFANTHGGHIVLGIDEIKNKEILIGFKKNGFDVGKEDEIKRDIRNYQVQIEPTPEFKTEIIPDNKKFYVVINIQNNEIKKPYFIKEKGVCYVRIGSTSTPASRDTILRLFSDTRKILEDLQNLKSSIIILKEAFSQTLGLFRAISSSPPNRVPKIDLTLLRSNVVKCESFLREKELLGMDNDEGYSEGITTILHTLDTLNSYIDGFSDSEHQGWKKILQDQIQQHTSFTLSHNLERVKPFLNKLIKEIDSYQLQIREN